uniref:Zinc finger ZPR1-type domain-containing protein n=1 Tax=Sphaeramia orbicularis TaxID=375764 RepID=A0A672Z712_9TELE
ESLTVTWFTRTSQQDVLLWLKADDDEDNEPAGNDLETMRNEVVLVQIPHFKEVIIMATNCDSCGHRTNEVKSGGKIDQIIAGELDVHIVLDDPAGNSYLQNVYKYTRSFEQNEDLGLNDMKTEDYQEEH